MIKMPSPILDNCEHILTVPFQLRFYPPFLDNHPVFINDSTHQQLASLLEQREEKKNKRKGKKEEERKEERKKTWVSAGGVGGLVMGGGKGREREKPSRLLVVIELRRIGV